MGSLARPIQPVAGPHPGIIASLTRDRWRRDPGVGDMIQYFDRPEHNSWNLLTKKEINFIAEQLKKCRDSFEYAARNYFWITNEENQDVLFNLWEAQELILDRLYWLKQRGMAQKLITLKARRLGCSTLIEALIAWSSMFFPNRNALIVSYEQDHAEYLFGIMLHILDHMPWWLKPSLANRTYDGGLWFENPDAEDRRIHPGLNSKIIVDAATSVGSVGAGVKLSGVHLSEYALWNPSKAKDIIESDMVYAISRNPQAFAILESTGRGSGTYAHRLWKANVARAEKAEWYPLFLPWFFEDTRRRVVDMGWTPKHPEEAMRERVGREWLRCDNAGCREYREMAFHGESLVNCTCPACNSGMLSPVVLDYQQLCFMEFERENKEAKGSEAVKALKEQLATTAEESWQLSGIQVFPQACFDWVNETLDKFPPVVGNLDDQGRVHWMKEWKHVGPHRVSTCGQPWCTVDHQYDEEHALRIWEWPKTGCEYVLGGDVSEGIGEDYSVGWINRIGRGLNPDVHVATYRTNRVAPADLAGVFNFLGRMYNTALMSIEYNYPTTADLVLRYYNYPNIFRWKHYDNINPSSNKFHWMTQYNTKPRLWQMAVRRLRAHLWVVRDPIFYDEMGTFQKEEADSRSASAERGSHDDTIIAALIGLFTSHDLDWDENAPEFTPTSDSGQTGMIQTKSWAMTCARCDHAWEAANPEDEICPNCGSIMVRGRLKDTPVTSFCPMDAPVKAYSDNRGPATMLDEEKIDTEELPSYDSL
jgi:hypothetical protein